jgi:hypothetical protein
MSRYSTYEKADWEVSNGTPGTIDNFIVCDISHINLIVSALILKSESSSLTVDGGIINEDGIYV